MGGAPNADARVWKRLEPRRRAQAANAPILKRLAEIDKTLLLHDGALRDIYHISGFPPLTNSVGVAYV